ncbi:MAG: DNA methyltransferase, partial [Myxococcota bacterium]
ACRVPGDRRDPVAQLIEQVSAAVETLLIGTTRDDRCQSPGRDEYLYLYGDLLGLVLRMVVLLHAEYRGLLSGRDCTADGVAVVGLDQLRQQLTRDAEHHPQSMAERHDAYSQLLTLFRVLSRDDSAGRAPHGALTTDTVARWPSSAIDDASLHLAMQQLLGSTGWPVCSADLSIEHIGAVYESLMNARVARRTTGPDQRRRTGSHYTPRQLTERVVDRTLAPILNYLGDQRSAEEILSIALCDPAMGSGAFLIAAGQRLAEEMIAAWARAGELDRIAAVHGDPSSWARRLVALRCLYGVDKNPAAVELARLSLWLFVGDGELPLSFADHALRCGDALVGLDLEHIRGVVTGADAENASALAQAPARAASYRAEAADLSIHRDLQTERRRRWL